MHQQNTHTDTSLQLLMTTNDNTGETTEMMPPPPEPREHGSKLQLIAQRRERELGIRTTPGTNEEAKA